MKYQDGYDIVRLGGEESVRCFTEEKDSIYGREGAKISERMRPLPELEEV